MLLAIKMQKCIQLRTVFVDLVDFEGKRGVGNVMNALDIEILKFVQYDLIPAHDAFDQGYTLLNQNMHLLVGG